MLHQLKLATSPNENVLRLSRADQINSESEGSPKKNYGASLQNVPMLPQAKKIFKGL